MKRVLSLFLAAAVLISCLTITAFADDSVSDDVAFEKSFVDLLDALTYKIYNNGAFVSERPRPNYYFASRGSSVSIEWVPQSVYEVIGFNFCLYSSDKPTSVSIVPFEGANFSLNASHVASSGNFHYYRSIANTVFDISNVKINIVYSGTGVNDDFSLINCYGYLPDSFSVDSVTMSHNAEYIENGIWDMKNIFPNTVTSLPKVIDYAWQVSHFSIYTIRFDLPVSNATSLSFNFSSLGAVVNDTGVNVGIYRGSELIQQIPIEIVQGMGTSTLLPNGKALLYTYTCNCDLSGIDLSGCTITLRVEVDSLLNDGLYLSKFNLLDIAYKQSSYVLPWYQKFYNWISAKMTAGYQSIVDAIKGDSNSEMNEATDQMEGAANDLKESSDAFEQVETPDIDAGALTGDFTNFSVSGLAVLGVITANPYVTSLLVLVFTFALCAYIFFGKKG